MKTSIIATVIFFFMLVTCSYLYGGYNITEFALSDFTRNKYTDNIFSVSVVFLGLLTAIFGLSCISEIKIRSVIVKFVRYGYVISGILLMFVGFIDKGHIIHDIVAAIYFLFLPIVMFCLSRIYNLIGYKRLANILYIIVFANVLIPLTTFFVFEGYMIPEIIHTIFVLIFNLFLSKRIKNLNLQHDNGSIQQEVQ